MFTWTYRITDDVANANVPHNFTIHASRGGASLTLENELPSGENPTPEAQPLREGRVYGPITYAEYLATLSGDPQGGGGMMLMSGCCDPGCGCSGNGCGCGGGAISYWWFNLSLLLKSIIRHQRC